MKSNLLSQTLVVLVVVLGTAYGWSEWSLAGARNDLLAAGDELKNCQQLAAKIVALKDRRERALLTTRPDEELAQRIEGWATASGIEPRQLLRIEPQTPRRIGETPYLEQATEVEISGCELARIVQLAERALVADESLSLSVLRLTAPRRTTEDSEAEPWNAELVLGSRIYSPASR